jgi:hypothetical protein
MSWVPTGCTLPTAQQPLRVAEFDILFTTALRHLSRPAPHRLQLMLDPTAEQLTRELIAKETACCSVFAFTLTAQADVLQLDIEVPDTRAPILDALAAHATRHAGLTTDQQNHPS